MNKHSPCNRKHNTEKIPGFLYILHSGIPKLINMDTIKYIECYDSFCDINFMNNSGCSYWRINDEKSMNKLKQIMNTHSMSTD
jgi:hypothetical protein